MKNRIAIALGVVVVVVVATVGWLVIARGSDTPAATDAQSSSLLVRPDSHRLNSVDDGAVTFVEFLDFECEACAAMFPFVEQLREQYGDRVTFVVRYFPLPGHVNAERAARAVEAASRQGQFEAMYRKMFQTQAQWGEQQVPADDVFTGFATELGLDADAFDAAYRDPATRARVTADVADGIALGVQGTPTFFVNGLPLRPDSYDDMTRALDHALAS